MSAIIWRFCLFVCSKPVSHHYFVSSFGMLHRSHQLQTWNWALIRLLVNSQWGNFSSFSTLSYETAWLRDQCLLNENNSSFLFSLNPLHVKYKSKARTIGKFNQIPLQLTKTTKEILTGWNILSNKKIYTKQKC